VRIPIEERLVQGAEDKYFNDTHRKADNVSQGQILAERFKAPIERDTDRERIGHSVRHFGNVARELIVGLENGIRERDDNDALERLTSHQSNVAVTGPHTPSQ
jgi:hypothetical protein